MNIQVWGEGLALVRSDRPESAALQQQHANSAGNQLNESRSTVIADYRAATAAAQRATEAARASLTAYSGAEQNHRRIRELQQQTGEALQPVERERKNELINIIKKLQNPKLSEDLLQNLESSLKQRLQSHLEQLVTGLNLKNEINELLPTMIYTEIEKQTAPLTEQLQKKLDSVATITKDSGLTENIFKALDELDRRRELQRVQERKNDRGYDSPSPF
jgi:hypothetical protein